MPQIDRLLSALVASRADALELVDGEPATFVTGADRRAATRQPLTATQILGIVREVAPPDIASQLGAQQAAEFRYVGEEGAFAVRVTRFGDRWGATVAAATTASPPPGIVTAAPARATMDRLLRALVTARGSDLHLRVGEPPVIRASGELERLSEPPLDAGALDAMLLSVMPERDRAQYAATSDADYAYEIDGVARFRANALRDRHGPAGVFRVIPATVVSVEEMGLSPEVQQLCQLTKGLVLVTGPTGSGKSTTLCAMVDLVNRSRADHILTIEDPIEFVHPSRSCA